jgi:hypothetical protein
MAPVSMARHGECEKCGKVQFWRPLAGGPGSCHIHLFKMLRPEKLLALASSKWPWPQGTDVALRFLPIPGCTNVAFKNKQSISLFAVYCSAVFVALLFCSQKRRETFDYGSGSSLLSDSNEALLAETQFSTVFTNLTPGLLGLGSVLNVLHMESQQRPRRCHSPRTPVINWLQDSLCRDLSPSWLETLPTRLTREPAEDIRPDNG